MAESFDFQVNDLKFRAATSDKFPYARATAPFRKEQFDAAPTVGDQSLSGWWTRGQLSFHKGAGLEFYEVLEGDEVLNRFDDSLAVDVLPKPGRASLFGALGDFVSTAIGSNLWWAAGVPVQSGSDKVAFVQNGSIYYATSGNAAVLEGVIDGGTATSVACAAPSLFSAFVATSNNGIERHVSDAGPAHLYTHTQEWKGLFYEKERLWAVDVLGDLYTLTTTPTAPPVAVASGDKLVSLGREADWSLTATPGDVYLADGEQTIYRITLDSDGSVPTLAAPIVSAVLPEGERIAFVRAHLGMVVIGTNKGVRVAVVDSGGGLIYGPIHEVGACGRSTTISGTSVWFVGGDGTYGATLYDTNYLTEIDLNREVSDLTFAWARRVEVGKSAYIGALTAGGYIGYYKGSDFGGTAGEIKTADLPGGTAGTKESTGFLRTAYHRLGTLDGKHFQEVLVRADGDGVIEVFLVDPEGTETSLGSMTVISTDPLSKSKTFSTGLTSPVERIALKFVFTPDAADVTKTPVLLGYQIKALPSPVRQRLIKWPLMIQDVVRDRYGVSRGAREGAWTAWSELESLEETDALVTFTDHRTGETGEAYIESLELQTDTPTQGSNSGFGGVGYITLRKVS